MFSAISSMAIILALSTMLIGQKTDRRDVNQSILDLRSQITGLENDLLSVDTAEVDIASRQGFGAIRLMPREKYERLLVIRGGGAYYSFERRTHEYGYGSDIELSQGRLSVGFAGGDYGFLIDLGETPLGDIGTDTREAKFLINYEVPTEERLARSEKLKLNGKQICPGSPARCSMTYYDANGFTYRRDVPAIVGHSYLLRSINFRHSDLVVALRIQNQDDDGSLVIFWKLVRSFGKRDLKQIALVQ
ncbi:MAG: hypothetical protein WKF34_04710 [Pyrinomonadaceae bacterium]